MIKVAGTLLIWLIIFASAFSYAKFQGGYSSWFLFFSTVAIGGYVFFTGFFAGKGLTSSRQLSAKKLTAGSELEVRLEIHSQSKWPLTWLMIEDQIPHRLIMQGGNNRRLFYPGFQKKIYMTYVIPNMQRGKYVLQDTILKTGDIFGFQRKQILHHRQDEIIVYPRVIPLKYWYTVNQFNTGMSFSRNRTAEDTTNVLGIRDYAPGDRLSRIHWQATARTGSIKSKEFELHVTNDLMFFLNRCQADYKSVDRSIFETAVTTTASLIRFGLEKKYSVGLISDGKERMSLPLNRNQEHYIRVLEHLALVQPDSKLPFSETVLHEINYMPRGATAIMISPVLTEHIVKLIGLLNHRKIKTEIFLIKHQSSISQGEQQLIGRLSLFGVHAITVGSEQELDEAVRGPMVHGTYN